MEAVEAFKPHCIVKRGNLRTLVATLDTKFFTSIMFEGHLFRSYLNIQEVSLAYIYSFMETGCQVCQ